MIHCQNYKGTSTVSYKWVSDTASGNGYYVIIDNEWYHDYQFYDNSPNPEAVDVSKTKKSYYKFITNKIKNINKKEVYERKFKKNRRCNYNGRCY